MLLGSPIIALAIIFIFSLTLFPSVQPQPKNLPIAIVNEDVGVEIPNQPKMNMGQTIVEMIQNAPASTNGEDPAVKWIEVISTEEVHKGLDNKEYYAALVIPKDFSAKQASLRTPVPLSPEVQIFINQGMHPAAATIAGQVLSGVVDNMNNTFRTQILEGFKAQEATLTVEQAASIATPITKTVTTVNGVGEKSANGNSPVMLFQPLWIASMVSAALIYLGASKVPLSTRKENLMTKVKQILAVTVIALVVGFGYTWIASGMVGLTIPDYIDTALFLTLTSFSFILMILAVLSLLGIRGIALFVILLFFGAPLLAMAPEMLSPFYRDWFYSWLPMRFMIEGLRELFFFGEGLTWNTSLSALVWIGIVSIIVILGSAYMRSPMKEIAFDRPRT